MRIAVEGNIGSGKSTVLGALAEVFAVRKEPVEEWQPLLDLFYADQGKWSLAFSLRVLLSFAAVSDDGADPADPADPAVLTVTERCPLANRHVFGQLLFNDQKMTQDEWDLFKEYHDAMGWTPDGIVFVDTPSDVCMDRIKARGRPCEASIDIQYLRRIEFQYQNLFKFCGVPVVRVDGSLPPAELAGETERAVRAVRALVQRGAE